MEDNKNKKNGIIITIIVLIVIIGAAAYGYFSAIPLIDNGVTADATTGDDLEVFVSETTDDEIDIDVSLALMDKNESLYGQAGTDSAVISVTLNPADEEAVTSCSFDLVWTYGSLSDIYEDAYNYMPYPNYPYEFGIEIQKNNTSISKNNMDDFGTPVNRKVNLGNYTISSTGTIASKVDEYKVIASIYNVPVDQENIDGKHYTSNINVENVTCDVVETSKTLGGYLINNVSTFTGLDTTDTYGLKRFVGSNTATVNNYICLGDSTTSGSCNSNNLYRIIGVVSNDSTGTNLTDGMIKVIKNSSVGFDKWDGGNSLTTGFIREDTYINYNGSNPPSTAGTSSGYVPTWDQSCLNKRNASCIGTEYSLNDNTNSFISSINFIDKIVSVPWHCYVGSPITISDELANSNICSYNRKIGLMYGGDYLLSYNNGINQSGPSYKGWLISSSTEWIISSSKYGFNSASKYYWFGYYVSSSGYLDNYYTFTYDNGSLSYVSRSYRPVFYLKPTVEYKSGTGTQSNPIRIA